MHTNTLAGGRRSRWGAVAAAATIAVLVVSVSFAGAAGASTSSPDPGLRSVQRRLAELGYDIGPADGRAGARTAFAVMAFQKVEGLPRTGKVDDRVRSALATARRPAPVVPGGEPTRVEVDIRRQVLLLWSAGRLTRVLPVSTGSGRRYCTAAGCEEAITPVGRFEVGRRINGIRRAALGSLAYPLYFHKGWAIHGSSSVPGTPASHGCVRIPMYASASFFSQVSAGTPVYIV